MNTEIESSLRELLHQAASYLRSESGPRLIAVMVLGAIGGVFLLVSAVPLAGESLRPGPEAPESPPELPALPDEETLESSQREDGGEVIHPPLPGEDP